MRTVGLAVGGLLLLAGVVFTLQGLGHLGGSAMTGDRTWAVIGPIVAVVGVGVGVLAARRSPPPAG